MLQRLAHATLGAVLLVLVPAIAAADHRWPQVLAPQGNYIGYGYGAPGLRVYGHTGGSVYRGLNRGYRNFAPRGYRNGFNRGYRDGYRRGLRHGRIDRRGFRNHGFRNNSRGYRQHGFGSHSYRPRMSVGPLRY